MLKRFRLLLLAFVLIVSVGANAQTGKYKAEQHVDANGYSYETYAGDPVSIRVYKLKNGLTVFMRVNKDEPRITVNTVVNAGSVFEPDETTGLAHYLEHMMFKGSSKLASADWSKEKPLLDELFNLYEEHRKASTPEAKKEIYHRIDSVSGVAAHYAVANEYDNLVAFIGGTGDNANTSNDRTAYVGNIPSNELERKLQIERERFTDLRLRLFHTELEAVYEEFNMYFDRDPVKVDNKIFTELFTENRFGGMTVIGRPEHLKNPSMYNIMDFYHKYYVPNNMAFCLSGDFEFEAAIKLIDKYFGDIKPGKLPEFTPKPERPINSPKEFTILGPSSESVTIGFRGEGNKSKDEIYMTLIASLLSNGKAGLIDLDLVQAQKVLSASAYSQSGNDYGAFVLSAEPKDTAQKLEELKQLLLTELEKIKKGDFDEKLISAVALQNKINTLRTFESNNIAYYFLEAFAQHKTWPEILEYDENIGKITKADIVKFANARFGNNYVTVYKRIGTDPNTVHVEKPAITAVSVNRDAESDFAKNLKAQKTEPIKPVFVDYEKSLVKKEIKPGLNLYYEKKTENELFQMNYIFDFGTYNSKKIALAADYLPLIGTDKYSPAELQKELYYCGLSFEVSSDKERTTISFTGLNSNFDKAMELAEHIVNSCKADAETYNGLVGMTLKKRMDDKMEVQNIIWGGLRNYAVYGSDNPFKNILSEKELTELKPEELTSLIQSLPSYKHNIFYYGPLSADAVAEKIKSGHKTAGELKDVPAKKHYEPIKDGKKTVYFCNFDIVQANIMFVAVDEKFNKLYIPFSELFGEYFGGGLSSVVFQEIRESKGLAYSAFSAYTVPPLPRDYHLVYGFIGTQADKLKTATETMFGLLKDMPVAPAKFDAARTGVLRRIESERITKSNIFRSYMENKDRGIDYDIRRDVYDYVNKIEPLKFKEFFTKHISEKNYTFTVVGKRENIDFEALKKLGEVKELTLEELFGY